MHDLQAARGASLTGARGHRSRRWVLCLVVAGSALALDQVSKAVVVARLSGHEPVRLVDDLLRLTVARNPGAAFSTASSFTPVITVIALVAAVVTVWFIRRVQDRVWAWALGLLLAGILGNLGDRLFREPGPFQGHVVDFLQLPHWPVFNVADICINVAALLIVVQVVRGVGLDGTRHTGEG
ncbi:MAG: signal peptidase II [Marmoricola sp.]